MSDGGDWKDMFSAALAGDLALVDMHLDHGIDVDYQHPEYLSSVLVAAICAGREEVAHHLLDRGADHLARSEFEAMTPVEAAASQGMDALVARLVEAGAPIPAVPASTSAARPWWRAWMLRRPGRD